MLHARGENNEDSFLGNAALSLVDQDAAGFLNKKINDADVPVVESRIGEIEENAAIDSGNESAGAESDSEDKKESIKAIKNALVGMNVSFIIKILLKI